MTWAYHSQFGTKKKMQMAQRTTSKNSPAYLDLRKRNFVKESPKIQWISVCWHMRHCKQNLDRLWRNIQPCFWSKWRSFRSSFSQIPSMDKLVLLTAWRATRIRETTCHSLHAPQGRSQGGSWGARDPLFCKPFVTKNVQQVTKMPWQYLAHS